MARAFTVKSVEAIKPDPEKRFERPDPGLQGLYLVVQPSGAKSWALRYRFDGKPAKLTLGRWPAMGIAEARRMAAEAQGLVERGTNPAGERKVAAEAAQRAAEATEAAKLVERDKVEALVADFDKRHLSKLKSGAQGRAFLDRFVVKAWGDRDIHTITKRDVIDLLDGIVDSGRATTANRVLAHLRKFLNWCVERDVLPASPALGVKPPTKERSRDRVLDDAEVALFWRACDALGEPWGPLGKMLLLTGQRLGEVTGMTEREVAGDLWRLSADRTKNGRAHDVPLSALAQRVLDDKVRVRGAVGFIFTTTGRAPVSGFDRAREHIAAKMSEIAAAEAGEPVDIPHWTFHDLRRTAATGMARLGIAVRVTEAVLNHVSGTAAGIVAVYQRHDYADEKRAALEAWGRHVEALVEGRADNVVPLLGAV